jgi:hypothetical protein
LFVIFQFFSITLGNFVGATSSLAPQHHQAVLHPQPPIAETQQQEQNRLSIGSIEKSAAILSPFDEKEEWNKISKIIDSFGADIGSDIKKSTTPNNCKLPKDALQGARGLIHSAYLSKFLSFLQNLKTAQSKVILY